MKKFVLFNLIFICCSLMGHAASAPQWNEFCPEEYLNPTILTANEIEKSVKEQPIFKKMNFREKLYYNNIMATYWSERKKQFENELSSCEGLTPDAKGMCYLKVREIEYKKISDEKQEDIMRGIQKQLFLQRY